MTGGGDFSGESEADWARGRAPTALRAALYLGLVGALCVMGFAAVRATQERSGLRESQDRLVAMHGLIKSSHKRLAADYSDKDGDLLADPPAADAKRLDPETLVLAHYEGDEDDAPPVDWEGFQKHLADATGKKIVGQQYYNSADEVSAIQSGEIHLVALHAADVPYAVNNAGLHPFAVLGSEAGANGNRLDLAVSPKSPIQKLADLRGRKLTCTRPDSITGYRAAIAVLAQEADLRPDVDYRIHFSHGQKRSVAGLLSGEFAVAALSDDKLAAMIKDGSLNESDYRVIYRSEVIPRLTLGCAYNLSPELAAKVQAAALAFANVQGAPDETTGRPMRFVAIDYKQDFAFARKIDDSFDPRFGSKPKESITP